MRVSMGRVSSIVVVIQSDSRRSSNADTWKKGKTGGGCLVTGLSGLCTDCFR